MASQRDNDERPGDELTDSGPRVGAAWVASVYRSYASVVDAHLAHLENTEQLMAHVRAGRAAYAEAYVEKLAPVITEMRASLQTAAAQCQGWRDRLDAFLKMDRALIEYRAAGGDESESRH
jgi:hypothetical protein